MEIEQLPILGNTKFSSKIEQSISEKYEFDVPVTVRNVTELNTAILNNPFFGNNDTDIERLHLTFLKEVPETDKLEKIKTYDYSPDKFDNTSLKMLITI